MKTGVILLLMVLTGCQLVFSEDPDGIGNCLRDVPRPGCAGSSLVDQIGIPAVVEAWTDENGMVVALVPGVTEEEAGELCGEIQMRVDNSQGVMVIGDERAGVGVICFGHGGPLE